MSLAGKKIVLGVSGGIAAYKTPELVRRLRDRGADVRVAMTEAAKAFIQAIQDMKQRFGIGPGSRSRYGPY